MMEEHSVNLLRECDSGCKMAAESLEQIRREDPAESAGMTTPSM